MDTQTIRDGLVELFGDMGEIPFVWAEEERPMVEGPIGLLNVIASAGLGVDDTRWADPGGVDPPVPAVSGNRRHTLSVQIETISQRAVGAARYTAERIRTRLRLPSSLDALHALGLAIVRLEPTTVLQYEHDERAYSRATLDVILAAVHEETDVALGYFNRIELTTEIKGPDGVLLPSPPNVEDLEIPE